MGLFDHKMPRLQRGARSARPPADAIGSATDAGLKHKKPAKEKARKKRRAPNPDDHSEEAARKRVSLSMDAQAQRFEIGDTEKRMEGVEVITFGEPTVENEEDDEEDDVSRAIWAQIQAESAKAEDEASRVKHKSSSDGGRDTEIEEEGEEHAKKGLEGLVEENLEEDKENSAIRQAHAKQTQDEEDARGAEKEEKRELQKLKATVMYGKNREVLTMKQKLHLRRMEKQKAETRARKEKEAQEKREAREARKAANERLKMAKMNAPMGMTTSDEGSRPRDAFITFANSSDFAKAEPDLALEAALTEEDLSGVASLGEASPSVAQGEAQEPKKAIPLVYPKEETIHQADDPNSRHYYSTATFEADPCPPEHRFIDITDDKFAWIQNERGDAKTLVDGITLSKRREKFGGAHLKEGEIFKRQSAAEKYMKWRSLTLDQPEFRAAKRKARRVKLIEGCPHSSPGEPSIWAEKVKSLKRILTTLAPRSHITIEVTVKRDQYVASQHYNAWYQAMLDLQAEWPRNVVLKVAEESVINFDFTEDYPEEPDYEGMAMTYDEQYMSDIFGKDGEFMSRTEKLLDLRIRDGNAYEHQCERIRHGFEFACWFVEQVRLRCGDEAVPASALASRNQGVKRGRDEESDAWSPEKRVCVGY